MSPWDLMALQNHCVMRMLSFFLKLADVAVKKPPSCCVKKYTKGDKTGKPYVSAQY